MTDAPQPNTEAARPKGLDGVHWLSGLYTLTRFAFAAILQMQFIERSLKHFSDPIALRWP